MGRNFDDYPGFQANAKPNDSFDEEMDLELEMNG